MEQKNSIIIVGIIAVIAIMVLTLSSRLNINISDSTGKAASAATEDNHNAISPSQQDPCSEIINYDTCVKCCESIADDMYDISEYGTPGWSTEYNKCWTAKCQAKS